MVQRSVVSAVALVLPLPFTSGFVPSPCQVLHYTTLSMTAYSEDEVSLFDEDNTEIDATLLPSQFGKKMSESIPFLNCPRVLRYSKLAGNAGFDPLGLAKNKEQLWEYREAEVKHARLAMLAAIGWPVSELLDRDIADFFQAPALLDDGDRVPTVLNGGLGHICPQFWGFCLGLSAAIDMYGIAKARRGGPDYFPGNLGFDPLNFFTDDSLVQERLKLAEIKHGRTAMVGVGCYIVEEYATKMAVVDDTPILFQPLTETVEDVFIGVMQAEEALAGVVLGSF
jgi:hypothetical protein